MKVLETTSHWIIKCDQCKETQEKAKKTISESKTRFELKTLMALGDYPRERELFYAQSTVLVNHLVRLGDEKAFVLFMR
jgi:hypothetical protein